MMQLDELYQQVAETISSLDMESIWRGFQPLKFALYNDEKCFFNGDYIEKSDAFCANTSILYQGEQIAIWKVEQDPIIPILTSKLVHEMFHGYQTLQKWNCWADEMEALYRYRYHAENLSLKCRENDLLLHLLDHFDNALYCELLSHRKERSEKFPYEYAYESKVEEIEGTATYVEWMVLKQLDEKAAQAMATHLRTGITKPEQLFPIRISCYNTGALMTHVLIAAGAYSFTTAERPILCSMLKNVHPSGGNFPGKDICYRKVSGAIASFNHTSEKIIRSTLALHEVVAEGPLTLRCVNIYDARFYKGHLTSRFFLIYGNEKGDHTIYGNFVLEMLDEKTISRIYKWDESSLPHPTVT